MRKRHLILIMAILLLLPALVFAEPKGQPFQEIWGAIANLQQQIDDLQSAPPTFNTYVVEEAVEIEPLTSANITVSCEEGDIALSGGYRIQSQAILHHFEPAPYDTDNPTGWRFVIVNPNEFLINNALEVLCLDLTP